MIDRRTFVKDGTINNGAWSNNKLKLTVETNQATLELIGTLQNGKLTGECDARQSGALSGAGPQVCAPEENV